MQEILTLQRVDHPNIVKIYEIFKDEKYLYIVMEFVEGQELFDYIIEHFTVPEMEAASIINQILKTIKYLNSLNICHRDLKPENIIIGKIFLLNLRLIHIFDIDPETKNIKIIGKLFKLWHILSHLL